MNFKLRQLEGFVAAAETGAFSKAADRLAMTQPAFSQLIRELEAMVGVRLFERTTRRMELTEGGRLLLAQVKRPLDDLQHAYANLRELAGGESGTVTFAVLPSSAFGLGTRAIAQLRERFPKVQVRQIEDQNDLLIDKVLQREVEFGLGMYSHEIPALRFDFMFTDELVAILPTGHARARARQIGWPELAAMPLVLLPAPSSVRRLVDAGLAQAGSHRAPAFEVVNMVTALSMVREGLGVTVLPRVGLEAMNLAGLVHRPIGPPRPQRQMGILRRVDRPLSAAAETLIGFLHGQAGEVARTAARGQRGMS
ncbi:LysR family transcriptional regulator [Pigmentiphaga kullae]|uniref:DNA-binding transcriptional LysR family regulator n=1 Tax=Pigmentiphaga kullae TaxID=151784 RepID=A0A4Q7NKJ7_9BURK|nr:LysR family transcriptional regulator [Pigmentiphaga kullae]RZS85621.1 DNA-binding transcriptional LysR family regulator [Pigmentiphaga kullae]